MFGVGPLEPRSCTPPFARILQNADQVRKFRHRAADSIMRAKPDEYESNGSALQGVGKRRAVIRGEEGEEGEEVETVGRRTASTSPA
jgi:hypothetical protein